MDGRTWDWVEKQLRPGERIVAAERLKGGWTSRMQLLRTDGPGGSRSLVLRSFLDVFYRRHADGLLTREADNLRLLGPTDVPAAELVAVDATAEQCEDPSLLMTLLPGAIRLDDAAVVRPLAEQLVRIHRIEVTDETRPRSYQAWTGPERVRLPAATSRPELWEKAVDGIRQDPPAYDGCFLHRDFHPGNVLFDGERISGVVDWVETSWGPSDLDVAHCSTALALLHGATVGLSFAAAYEAAGGTISSEPYWRLLDALAYAPDAEKVAVPWREVGRTDLTPALLQSRLEDYLEGVLG
jgi:aminoglycoside phosphotransferase (APT) family kinase protein